MQDYDSRINELLTKNKPDLYANGNGYINHYRYYSNLFNEIPNRLNIENIAIKDARNFIYTNYNQEIRLENFAQSIEPKKSKIEFEDHYIVFKNNLVINLYEESVFLIFETSLTEFAYEFAKKLFAFKIIEKRTNISNISLIIKGNYGLDTKSIKIKKPKLDIDLHYNDDFKDLNNHILKGIKRNKTQGLYLFHGLPGTGKSTYIKYLIQQQTKTVIFMPPNMAGNLDSMELTEFLIDNPNCILVIEDAEDLIDRKSVV